jgi:hypothetical protein
MERSNQPSSFINQANSALEKEAQNQQQTTTTTTAAPAPTTTTTTGAQQTTTTTTAAQVTTTTTLAGQQGPTTTTTTIAGNTTTTTQQQAQVTNEMLLNHMRQVSGNQNLTMEEMLEAVNKPAPLTDEQKIKQEQQEELRLQAEFINSNKGTIDDFHRIRQSVNIKDDQLVREAFYAENRAIDDTLTDKDLEDMFNEHYFIGPDGTYSAAQKKFGEKKIANEAKNIRTQMGMPLEEVQNDLTMKSEAVKEAKEWEKRAKQFTQNLPKSFQVPIGKIGETEVGDFIYNFSDEEQRDFAASLEDPAFLLKQIADEKTGKTDLNKLFNLVRNNRVLSTAIKAAAGEFYSKGVDSISSGLNNSPDLRKTGQQETPDATAERLQGEEQIKRDARNTFGKGPRVKSIK